MKFYILWSIWNLNYWKSFAKNYLQLYVNSTHLANSQKQRGEYKTPRTATNSAFIAMNIPSAKAQNWSEASPTWRGEFLNLCTSVTWTQQWCLYILLICNFLSPVEAKQSVKSLYTCIAGTGSRLLVDQYVTTD